MVVLRHVSDEADLDIPSDIHGQATVDEDPDLKLEIIRVLAVALGDLADVRNRPVVNGYLEEVPGGEAGHEACHVRHGRGPVDVQKLDVGHDMAANLELLKGRLGVPSDGEEDDVPVLVPHGEGGCW